MSVAALLAQDVEKSGGAGSDAAKKMIHLVEEEAIGLLRVSRVYPPWVRVNFSRQER